MRSALGIRSGALAAGLLLVGLCQAGDRSAISDMARDDGLIGAARTVTARYEDTLIDLAAEHGVGYRAIRRANPAVDPWLPGAGTQVHIPRRHVLPDAPREGLVLNLPEMRLYHFAPVPGEPDRLRVATYPVGIGRQDWSTPLGTSRIAQRLEDPAWYPPESLRREAARRGEPLPAVIPPGPDNPLGRYALILDISGYLIHGTNRPYGIGMRVSHGCVRLHPRDMAELFPRVRRGTPVRIIDQRYKAAVHDGALYVEVHPPLEEERSASDGAGSRNLTPLAKAVMRAAREAGGGLLDAVDWDRVEATYDAAKGVPVRVTPPR